MMTEEPPPGFDMRQTFPAQDGIYSGTGGSERVGRELRPAQHWCERRHSGVGQ